MFNRFTVRHVQDSHEEFGMEASVQPGGDSVKDVLSHLPSSSGESPVGRILFLCPS